MDGVNLPARNLHGHGVERVERRHGRLEEPRGVRGRPRGHDVPEQPEGAPREVDEVPRGAVAVVAPEEEGGVRLGGGERDDGPRGGARGRGPRLGHPQARAEDGGGGGGDARRVAQEGLPLPSLGRHGVLSLLRLSRPRRLLLRAVQPVVELPEDEHREDVLVGPQPHLRGGVRGAWASGGVERGSVEVCDVASCWGGDGKWRREGAPAPRG